MRVGELMHTPPVRCQPSTTVTEAARLMADKNVGCVIVVDHVGDISGVLTDRDIAIRGVANGRSGDVAVEAIMTRDVATISPRAEVADAAELMRKRAVRRLPVRDEHGALHGLLALDDLVRHLGHETEGLTELLVVQAAHLPEGS